MATIDTLITDLQSWTGTSSTVLPGTTCAEFVNTAVRRLERTRPYRGTITTMQLEVGSTGYVALPTDFIGEIGVWLVGSSSTSGPTDALRVMRRWNSKRAWLESNGDADETRDSVYPNIAARGTVDDNGITGYFIEGQTIVVVPTPSSSITVQVDYARQLPDLVATTATSNVFVDLFPDVVRFGALREAYLYLHEEERAALYEQLFQAAAKEATQRDEATTAAGPTPIRGK